MSKYRIIKETNKEDEVRYYIEKNTKLWEWDHVDKNGYSYRNVNYDGSIFECKTIEEAREKIEYFNKPIKREIIM